MDAPTIAARRFAARYALRRPREVVAKPAGHVLELRPLEPITAPTPRLVTITERTLRIVDALLADTADQHHHLAGVIAEARADIADALTR